MVLLNLCWPLESEACSAVLRRVDLDPKLLPVPVTALSGGQRQRVAVGRLLRQQAELLLADEPLAQLDPRLAQQLLELLLQLGRQPCALLISLHRPDLLAGFDRVLGLRQGQLAFDLPVADLDESMLEHLYAPAAER
jgi:phosphonate transport system ATP-binding protein